MAVRILVVDDHEVVRHGVRMILESRAGWEVCGQASDGTEAVQMAARLQPDAIIMDITMPEMNGLEATRRITRLGLRSPVLIFTMHEFEGLVDSVQSAGARGLVFKSRAGRDLIEALERLLNGETYFNTAKEESEPPRKRLIPGFLKTEPAV